MGPPRIARAKGTLLYARQEQLRLHPAAPRAAEVSVGDTYAAPAAVLGGLPSARTEVAATHPVEVISRHGRATEDQLHLAMRSIVVGSHLPMRIQMERAVVGRHERLPVLPSSRVGLDILEGKDETLEIDEYLADPELAAVSLDPHSAMEHKLRMAIPHH